MKSAQEPPKRLGRPPHDRAVRFQAAKAVARQRKRQGKKAGWRPIDKALESQVPTRLVQEMVRRFKKKKRRRQRRHQASDAEKIIVKVIGAIWTQDGTHLGRYEDGEESQAQVLKDRGPLDTVGLSIGPPATSKDVLMLLKCSKAEHGGNPLVWQTDNDSIYLEKDVQDYLEMERVVHLKSRVGRPTDNGAAERGIWELKSDAELGKGFRLSSPLETALRLGRSAVKIDEHRLRGSKGYATANRLAAEMPFWYDLTDRNTLYEEATTAMKSAREGKAGDHARKAERDAVHGVLEKHGLIEWTRGGRILTVCEQENIS
jgi:transposase InsO family protein